MKIESTRFGSIEVGDDAVIVFPDGLIGLPGRRYALVNQTAGAAFSWLQSVEDASLALPVTNPALFYRDYEVQVSDEEAAKLELADVADAQILCVVRAAERIEDFTINLRGPLVVNRSSGIGRQVINEIASYGVRQPLFGRVALAETAATKVPVAGSAG
jgi:flagellar assembly factor FliW